MARRISYRNGANTRDCSKNLKTIVTKQKAAVEIKVIPLPQRGLLALWFLFTQIIQTPEKKLSAEGQPIELASVTLVYKDADIYSVGDIASSGFLVLGLKKGIVALRQFPGVEAIFVTTDGKAVVTPGLQDKIE
jgi:hypothetical protein